MEHSSNAGESNAQPPPPVSSNNDEPAQLPTGNSILPPARDSRELLTRRSSGYRHSSYARGAPNYYDGPQGYQQPSYYPERAEGYSQRGQHYSRGVYSGRHQRGHPQMTHQQRYSNEYEYRYESGGRRSEYSYGGVRYPEREPYHYSQYHKRSYPSEQQQPYYHYSRDGSEKRLSASPESASAMHSSENSLSRSASFERNIAAQKATQNRSRSPSQSSSTGDSSSSEGEMPHQSSGYIEPVPIRKAMNYESINYNEISHTNEFMDISPSPSLTATCAPSTPPAAAPIVHTSPLTRTVALGSAFVPPPKSESPEIDIESNTPVMMPSECTTPMATLLNDPSLPSKESILQNIEKVDAQISKIEKYISDLNLRNVPPPEPLYSEPSDLALYHEQIERHAILKPKITAYLQARKAAEHAVRTKIDDEYQLKYKEWKAQVKILEKEMAPVNHSIQPSALDSQHLLPAVRHASSNDPFSTHRSRGSVVSDIVRSEEEMAQLLKTLEQQQEAASELPPEKRYKDIWSKTLAVIPEMIVEPLERCRIFVDNNGFDLDPLMTYNAHPQVFWSENEKQIFIATYLQYPKRFHKIAAALPGKSTSDCVAYYYQIKKSVNFKKLSKQQRRKTEDTTATTVKEKHIHLKTKKLAKESTPAPVSRPPSTAAALAEKEESYRAILSSWTEEEAEKFHHYFPFCGKNWIILTQYIPSKSSGQIKQYYQAVRYFNKGKRRYSIGPINAAELVNEKAAGESPKVAEEETNEETGNSGENVVAEDNVMSVDAAKQVELVALTAGIVEDAVAQDDLKVDVLGLDADKELVSTSRAAQQMIYGDEYSESAEAKESAE